MILLQPPRRVITDVALRGFAIIVWGAKDIRDVLGGVSLLMDKTVHLGNLCKIGD